MSVRADEFGDGLLDEARNAGEPRALVWEPRAPLVVLGRSNQAERECDAEACRALGIPVVQRRGGGGAVLLVPGMVVVTIAGPTGESRDAGKLFCRVNKHLASLIEGLGAPALAHGGVSDLCLGERKVLGCSLAFSRGFALYQGCLLVDCELELVERCLRHPSREPAYRAGRSHSEFLTTLKQAGSTLGAEQVRAGLERGLDAAALRALFSTYAPEACAP
jgi:lipoate-protein ligase A